MGSRKKILVINVHSAQNAGDLALLQTTIALLRQEFRDALFIVSSNFPSENAVHEVADDVVPSPWRLAGGETNQKTRYLVMNLFLGWLSAITRNFRLKGWAGNGWNTLFTAYEEADLVVAVSGNQFFSSGRFGWPLLAIAISIKLAGVFKKPLYIMPQSIGPLRTWWERLLLHNSYSIARKIYLRDNQSMLLARRVNLPSARVMYVPDPAFTLHAATQSEAQIILEKYGYQKGMPCIGVTIIASMPSYLDQGLVANYYSSVAQSLSQISRKYNIHIFFFHQVIGPSSQEDDRIATEKVVQQMEVDYKKIHLVSEILNPMQLKACYGCMDMFLASRLHSGIFSMGMCVPTIFIGYLSKTRGVLQALGLEQHLIELSDITRNRLFTVLEQTWAVKDVERVSLKTATDGIGEQIRHAVSEISRDFNDQYD